jgi:hypothetical protein
MFFDQKTLNLQKLNFEILINAFSKLVKLKVQILLTSSGNKVVEHAPHQPKVTGSNLAITVGIGREITV